MAKQANKTKKKKKPTTPGKPVGFVKRGGKQFVLPKREMKELAKRGKLKEGEGMDEQAEARKQEDIDVKKKDKEIFKEREKLNIPITPMREADKDTEEVGFNGRPAEAGGVMAVEPSDILAMTGISGIAKAGVGAVAGQIASRQAIKEATLIAEQQIVKNVMIAKTGRLAWEEFQTGARTIRYLRGTAKETTGPARSFAEQHFHIDTHLTQKVVGGKPIDFTYPLKVVKDVINPKLLLSQSGKVGIAAVKTNPKSMGLTAKILIGVGVTVSATSLIMGIAGTYPFSKFVGKEEALQTLNFPIGKAIEVGLFDVARSLNEDAKSLIALNQTKIPVKNVNDALLTFVNDAALPATEAWDKIIEEHEAITAGERETQFDIERKAYKK